MTAPVIQKVSGEGDLNLIGEHKLKDGQVSFSVGCGIAWALWSLSVTTLIIGVSFDVHELAAIAIVTAVAAGTATLRTYFVVQNRMLRRAIAMRIDDPNPVRLL